MAVWFSILWTSGVTGGSGPLARPVTPLVGQWDRVWDSPNTGLLAEDTKEQRQGRGDRGPTALGLTDLGLHSFRESQNRWV